MRNVLSFCVVFSCVGLVACNSDKDIEKAGICNSLDPVNEINWLSEIINTYEYPIQVAKYNYSGEQIIKVDYCLNCPLRQIIYYNCQGEVTCQWEGSINTPSCQEIEEDSLDFEILYDTTEDPNL